MNGAALPWGKWRVLAYTLLVAGVFLATQIAVTLALARLEAAANPDLDLGAWFRDAGTNGFVLSVSTFATALTCVPLIWFLARRREPAPWSYLGVRAVSPRSLLLWCVTVLAFMLFSDLLTVSLGKPLVPPYFADLYASASAPFLLLLALVAAAPLLEELFFRGFMLSALDSLGLPFRVGATASSLAWAAIHSQYGLYELALIFVMGLLLAEARYRSRSIIPCIAMHSVSNLGAFVEAALTAS